MSNTIAPKMSAAFRACILVLALLLPFAAGCAKSPYTGRSQLILLSPEEEYKLGLQGAQQVKKTERIVRQGPEMERVLRVGQRIADVSGRDDFDWHFYTVDKPDVLNAFCLPGGQVFVYTGILKLAKSDDELATVMGHEIAHALLRHGAERMSRQMLLQFGGSIASAALDISYPGTGAVFSQAYGIGTTVGFVLPHSRGQETEADYVGLLLMTRAGYDPYQAVVFWRKMLAANKGGRPPAWLSTHPPEKKRIQELEAAIPGVLAKVRSQQ